jgi:hypothetical protein
MLFDKKFDLIFSIGAACSCTQMLRSTHLQFYSYPFDWLYGASILERVEILINDMKDFINKEDLEYAHEERSISCNAYFNKHNNITFNHDFLKDVPFDEMYEKVREKYDRRSNRLLEQIKNSKNVLFVYLQTPDNKIPISDEELIKAQKLLQNKFNSQNIYLLYLFCDNLNPSNTVINNNILKIQLDYDAKDKNYPYVVNSKILKNIFNKLKITNKFITYKNQIRCLFYKLKLFLKGLLWKKI